MTNSPIIAAIDVGTNSFHMVIASVNSKGMMRILSREKEMVRLGSGSGEMKFLQTDAIERGVIALQKFVKLANNHNAVIRAVATSAVREAINKNEFLNRVQSECGIDIEVVSGSEEGRLIFIGMMHALPVYEQKSLLIDIGGGSTETVIGQYGKIVYCNSEKLGTIRLTQGYFNDYITNSIKIEEARNYVRGQWLPVLDNLKSEGFDLVVGTSGAIETIAKVALANKGKAVPEILNGINIKSKDFLEAIDLILNTSTPKERELINGMDAKRADIIVGGAIIIEFFIKYLEISKILISPYALREGIVFETLQTIKDRNEYNHLSRLRFESVINICRQFNINLDHSEAVKNYSLSLFDQLQELHGYGRKERELLEAASYLHDIGYSISHDNHHKHSYYIIMNSDMPGFTNDETELIANISRYHRKSTPKLKHENFLILNDKKKKLVNLLSSLLRIAEALDRRQLHLISSIDVTISQKIEIFLHFDKNSQTPDLELWQADRRKLFLEKLLKKSINFQF